MARQKQLEIILTTDSLRKLNSRSEIKYRYVGTNPVGIYLANGAPEDREARVRHELRKGGYDGMVDLKIVQSEQHPEIYGYAGKVIRAVLN